MKSAIHVLALALAVAAPAISFAQPSDVPPTRVQVRDELVQLQNAGYRPDKAQYPADIQAAEARVAAQSGATGAASTGAAGRRAAHRRPVIASRLPTGTRRTVIIEGRLKRHQGMRILLIEDNVLAGSGLQHGPRHKGYAADWAQDGDAALLALRTTPISSFCSIWACSGRMACRFSLIQQVQYHRQSRWNAMPSGTRNGDSPPVPEVSVLVPRESDNDDVQDCDEQQPY